MSAICVACAENNHSLCLGGKCECIHQPAALDPHPGSSHETADWHGPLVAAERRVTELETALHERDDARSTLIGVRLQLEQADKERDAAVARVAELEAERDDLKERLAAALYYMGTRR